MKGKRIEKESVCVGVFVYLYERTDEQTSNHFERRTQMQRLECTHIKTQVAQFRMKRRAHTQVFSPSLPAFSLRLFGNISLALMISETELDLTVDNVFESCPIRPLCDRCDYLNTSPAVDKLRVRDRASKQIMSAQMERLNLSCIVAEKKKKDVRRKEERSGGKKK